MGILPLHFDDTQRVAPSFRLFFSIKMWRTFIVVVVTIGSVLGQEANPFLPLGNVSNDDISKIINSEPAVDGRYSFAHVSLQLPNALGAYQHQCGGSIIAEDMLLTAGHCSAWFDRIYIDRFDLEDPNETSFASYTPSTITVHPLFDSVWFRYDFTVVQISESIPNIAPIRLNQNSSIPQNGAALTIVGWGATEKNGDYVNFPSALQKGQVFAIDNTACANTVINGQSLYLGEIFDEMLCAQSASGVDACSGDSGGPLILETGSSSDGDLQVGIISWGRGCAVYPGVYSRISEGYGWIREKVCYQSKNPPSYMQCQDWERDPKYVTTDPEGKLNNSTVPSAVPSRSPAVPMSAPMPITATARPSHAPSPIPIQLPVAVGVPDTTTQPLARPSNIDVSTNPPFAQNPVTIAVLPVTTAAPIAVAGIVGVPTETSAAAFLLLKWHMVSLLCLSAWMWRMSL